MLAAGGVTFSTESRGWKHGFGVEGGRGRGRLEAFLYCYGNRDTFLFYDGLCSFDRVRNVAKYDVPNN